LPSISQVSVPEGEGSGIVVESVIDQEGAVIPVRGAEGGVRLPPPPTVPSILEEP
jgi:hypothetical protein